MQLKREPGKGVDPESFSGEGGGRVVFDIIFCPNPAKSGWGGGRAGFPRMSRKASPPYLVLNC